MKRLPTDQNEDILLRTISDGTASVTGSRFFRALVKNLSKALGTHGAWVTEYLPDLNRLRALAFWLGGKYVDHYEYDIRGTPCEKLLRKKDYLHVPDKVVDLFPGDPDLPEIGAVSYIGFPLLDEQNGILGNVAVVDTRPMPDSFRNFALFRIFAARATAEILRLRVEENLKDREEKLRRIFDGAMDGILELDQKLRIVTANLAAENLLGGQEHNIVGTAFAKYLHGGEFQRLSSMIEELQRNPHGQNKMWIPEGLAVVNRHGRMIRTEATLSFLERQGIPGYVLIIRDISERFEHKKLIASLQGEALYLRDEIKSLYNHGDIIGKSKPFLETLELISEVAPTDSTILLNGETGTGKELLARTIHAASGRNKRPLITVNCAAIPDSLMESEFFGHEKGAFTGATRSREGRFSLADGGTIFLDEIGELSLELQAKLLRVLQEGEFAPVGSSKNRKVDVRVIAATNRDLLEASRQGVFRTDLYYRLSVMPITIPSLKERSEDIELLATHFVEKYAAKMSRQVQPLSEDLVRRLQRYSWPGNVRELQNVIERAVITSRDGRLNLDFALPQEAFSGQLPFSTDRSNVAGAILTSDQMRELEKENLLTALRLCRWKIAGEGGAAKVLGLPPTTLQSRMKALRIRRPD